MPREGGAHSVEIELWTGLLHPLRAFMPPEFVHN